MGSRQDNIAAEDTIEASSSLWRYRGFQGLQTTDPGWTCLALCRCILNGKAHDHRKMAVCSGASAVKVAYTQKTRVSKNGTRQIPLRTELHIYHDHSSRYLPAWYAVSLMCALAYGDWICSRPYMVSQISRESTSDYGTAAVWSLTHVDNCNREEILKRYNHKGQYVVCAGWCTLEVNALVECTV